MYILRYSLLLLFCIFAFHALAPSASTSRRIDFNRDIRPILSDKCFVCHGPDAPGRMSRLRLDSEAGAKADLGGGRRAIVPGRPAESELVRRITSEDEALRMPPVYSGRQLTKEEKELLVAWIEQGAEWERHWSFIPPERPPLPEVKRKDWPRNAIDRFVLARLEAEGLAPSPEADREPLIRRLSLDLTGLPPTPAEVDAFLRDQSPQAYERVVDRLLASPRYGERMAFRWLDAARYADTNGYQIDGERSMWRWRDYVIESFNSNKPFDRFVVEQLAGDLLPNAGLEERLATAFNRNHRTNSEDGIVPEEYAVEYVVDRVDTTSTVFLGLTMGCARCHNHKYDPITQREYYQLYAFFNSIPEDGRASNYGNSPPWIAAPTRAEAQKRRALEQQIEQAEETLAALAKRYAHSQARWERALRSAGSRQWFPSDHLIFHHPLDPDARPIIRTVERVDPSRPEGRPAERPQARTRAKAETKAKTKPATKPATKPETKPEAKPETKPEPKKDEIGFKHGAPRYAAGRIGKGAVFDGEYFYDAGKTANFNFRDRLRDYKDQFAISAWFYPETPSAGAIVSRVQDTAGEKDNGLPKNRGYGLFFVNGKIHFNLVSVWADDSFRVETAEEVEIKKWHHVVAIFDSTEPYEKVRIYLDGRPARLKTNLARLFRTFGDSNANLRIGGGAGPDYRFRGMIDEVRIYRGVPGDDEIAILACPDSLREIAAVPEGERSEGQRLKIERAFFEMGAPLEVRRAWRRIRELKDRLAALEATFSTVMVMQEMPEPRPAFVLKRGSYDAPAERVERAVPAVLPPMPKDLPRNRLGLARWLVSAENPLTARVTVNRFWAMLFGAGLVRTVEDFGAQGEAPSHPELLDYLAVEFRESGWDVKALLKQIVMSATYRQSSKLNRQLEERDPENRLLGRGARLRLPAEMIRDSALFVSGLLVERIGGPSVKPYQPEGLYKDMVFSNMTEYERSRGPDLWRRSLYTYWKRTVMPPAMAVFDASARESCTVRETRTNTPLQALNLMNDVTYVEAARMLAERMMKEGGATAEARLRWAFRALTARRPDAEETRILLAHLRAQLDHFRARRSEAARLLAEGEKRNDARLDVSELAAYAATASLMLNLDEVVTRQ